MKTAKKTILGLLLLCGIESFGQGGSQVISMATDNTWASFNGFGTPASDWMTNLSNTTGWSSSSLGAPITGSGAPGGACATPGSSPTNPGGVTVPTGQYIWNNSYASVQTAFFRKQITTALPGAFTVTSATILGNADDSATYFINGHQINTTSPTVKNVHTNTNQTISVSLTDLQNWLTPGSNNVIAIIGKNGADWCAGVSFTFNITVQTLTGSCSSWCEGPDGCTPNSVNGAFMTTAERIIQAKSGWWGFNNAVNADGSVNVFSALGSADIGNAPNNSNLYGLSVSNSSDRAFFGTRNNGADLTDAVVAWGDNGPSNQNPNGSMDNLLFEFHGAASCGSSSPTEVARMLANGSVGIGTAAPTYYQTSSGSAGYARLAVDMSNLGGTGGLLIKGGGTTNWPTLGFSLMNTASTPQTILGAYIAGRSLQNTAGAEAMDLYFATKNQTGGTSATERMTVKYDGKIGIGTTAPASTLEVKGQSVWLTGGDGGALSNAGAGLRMYYDASANNLGEIFAWDYTAVTGGAKNLGIQAPGGSLAVGSSTSFSYSGYSGAAFYNAGATPASSSGTIKLDVSGVTRATAYYATSDATLKTAVENIKDPMSILSKLTGKTYLWNEKARKENGADNGRQFGFMAQEVEKVMPAAVIKDATGKYAMNYDMIIPLLTEAVKELNTKNTANAELNKKVADLQKQLDEICSSGCASLKGSGGSNAEAGNTLYQNVPNPFSQQTVISYAVNNGNSAYLDINALDGKQIKHLELSAKGQGSVTINANELSSGTYTYTLYVDGKVIDTKLMVIAMK